MLILKAPRQKLERVRFSPDGRGLAAGGAHGLYWWDLSAGAAGMPAATGRGWPSGFAFDSSGDVIISSTGEGGLRTFHAPTRGEICVLAGGRYLAVAASPTEPLVVTADRVTYGRPQPLAGWRVGEYGRLRAVWTSDLKGPWLGVRFTRDGEWVTAVRPTPTGREAVFCRPDTGDVDRVEGAVPEDTHELGAWSPDGTIYAWSYENTILVGPVPPTPADAGLIRNDSGKHFTGVAFHPSGRFLAATSNDETVKVYDPATLALIRTFRWDAGKMRSIAFSPDGTLAAAGTDTGRVVVWDVDL